MKRAAHPFRWFKVALGLGAVVGAALVAIAIIRNREPVFEPDQRYHFEGRVEGLGQVEAWLSVAGDSPGLQLVTHDGRQWVELFGERQGGDFVFQEVDHVEAQAKTNRIFRCTLIASPLALLGAVRDVATGKSRDFELHPVATYEVLRRRTGFRLGQRGWRASFNAAIPVFLTPTDLEQEAMSWLGQEMPARAADFIKENKPTWEERGRYLWEPSATAEWTFDSVWFADYHSPEVLSLRADHYSYTGGAHGNSQTECQVYWKREGDVQRVQLDDLFKPGSSWERRLSDLIIADLKQRGAGWVTNGERQTFARDELPAFTVSRQGLAFYFDPYAVGSYAEGRYRVFVPFKELELVLRSDGVVGDLRGAERLPKE